ncbi:MAG: hypothetical protein U0R50_16055 [Gaiellales bacterium]
MTDLSEMFGPTIVEALERLVNERVAAALAELDGARADRTWLTLEEAGERLGCSAEAVRMRASRGRLESRRHGRRLYVSAVSVERLGR